MAKVAWQQAKDYQEIIYEKAEGIAKISINRPHRCNAFTPLTVQEMYDAFSDARDDAEIGVIILTGVNHGGEHKAEFRRRHTRHLLVFAAVVKRVKSFLVKYAGHTTLCPFDSDVPGESSHLQDVENIVVHVRQLHLAAKTADDGTHRGLQDAQTGTGHVTQLRAVNLQIDSLFQSGLDLLFELCGIQSVNARTCFYDSFSFFLNNLSHNILMFYFLA